MKNHLKLDITDLKIAPTRLGSGPRGAKVKEVPAGAIGSTKTGTQVVTPPKLILYGTKGWPAFEVSSVISTVSLVEKNGSIWTKVWSVFVIKAYATPDLNGVGFATYLFDAGGDPLATSVSQMVFPCGPSGVTTVPTEFKGSSVYNSANSFTWGILNGKMVNICY